MIVRRIVRSWIIACSCLLCCGAGAQVITEFSAGITGGASPAGIAAGPDGNLWFAEVNGNAIGRITPLGVVTEFGAGVTARGAPLWHHQGPRRQPLVHRKQRQPDRADHSARRRHRVRHGHQPGASPAGIAAGPDGNLWFAESNGNRIGRITPLGVVTEFGAGITAGAYPFFIAAGSRRQPVVHGGLDRPDRADYPARRRHRVQRRDHRRCDAHVHRGRSRRQPLVHRALGRPDRTDHPPRSRHRVRRRHLFGAHPAASRAAPTEPVVHRAGSQDRSNHSAWHRHRVQRRHHSRVESRLASRRAPTATSGSRNPSATGSGGSPRRISW